MFPSSQKKLKGFVRGGLLACGFRIYCRVWSLSSTAQYDAKGHVNDNLLDGARGMTVDGSRLPGLRGVGEGGNMSKTRNDGRKDVCDHHL